MADFVPWRIQEQFSSKQKIIENQTGSTKHQPNSPKEREK